MLDISILKDFYKHKKPIAFAMGFFIYNKV